MEKMKNVCITLGIAILILAGVILVKDVYYTIKIKSEISLSDEEKKEINEKELMSDIKAYIYRRSFKYAEPKQYHWEKGISPPIMTEKDTIYCGNGYEVREYYGKFYTASDNHRPLYTAEHNSNFIIYVIIIILLIIEMIFTSIYVIKRKVV